jgi:hypothetical protein
MGLTSEIGVGLVGLVGLVGWVGLGWVGFEEDPAQA